jgi:sphingolipid delta-4 desaturase
MDHHRFQGVEGVDGDLPTDLEAMLFNNTFGKLLFCSIQIIFYAIRPKLVATPRTYRLPRTLKDWMFSWYTMNYGLQLAVMSVVVYYFGVNPIIYLAISVFMGGSLHPMAGHFIAEHYVTSPGQETYSYYGPLNL